MAADHPELDLGRVAIRGWSFGGYLAALAVLRRPDVFHAAVAGAPVTDWRLCDTHYSRTLPGTAADPDPTGAAPCWPTRPSWNALLLIHGLADDNVVAAHTLRLSGLLLAAGRPTTSCPCPASPTWRCRRRSPRASSTSSSPSSAPRPRGHLIGHWTSVSRSASATWPGSLR